MSPKKAHEVDRLTSLVSALAISENDEKTRKRKILDLGAGQGHLSRTLARAGFEVTAIDRSHQQSQSGIRLAKILSKQDEVLDHEDSRAWLNRLNYHTIDLDLRSVQETILESEEDQLIVGLHACGELSTTILESFISSSNFSNHSMVLVGCCYNLCDPTSSGFPFSSFDSLSKPLLFSNSHRQLACQSPLTWTCDKSNWDRTKLSITKLNFRSLWQSDLLRRSKGSNLEDQIKDIRLGRLPDRVYSDYNLFNEFASKRYESSSESQVSDSKIGFLKGTDVNPIQDDYYRLFIAWTLRSLIGPCIESIIVLDRYLGMCERLEKIESVRDTHQPCDDLLISIVNLFDQNLNSLRNLAIVAHPLPE
ncbi:methyltransferase domain-containing protein [Phakopsora pachyrhizi]|nr:methyltransferase domain-containing protein [Phakopsora pachyrhizi]